MYYIGPYLDCVANINQYIVIGDYVLNKNKDLVAQFGRARVYTLWV